MNTAPEPAKSEPIAESQTRSRKAILQLIEGNEAEAPSKERLEGSDIDLLYWFEECVLPFAKDTADTIFDYDKEYKVNIKDVRKAASLASVYKIKQGNKHVSTAVLDEPKNLLIHKIVDLGYVGVVGSKYYAIRGIAKR